MLPSESRGGSRKGLVVSTETPPLKIYELSCQIQNTLIEQTVRDFLVEQSHQDTAFWKYSSSRLK